MKVGGRGVKHTYMYRSKVLKLKLPSVLLYFIATVYYRYCGYYYWVAKTCNIRTNLINVKMHAKFLLKRYLKNLFSNKSKKD